VPTEQDHLALAVHNQETIDFLLTGGDRFPDWVSTVAFYKAIHLIEALIAKEFNTHGVDHKGRRAILKAHNRYANIYRQYMALEEAANIARYLCDYNGGRSFRTFTDYCAMADVKSNILGGRLRELERSLAALKPPKKK